MTDVTLSHVLLLLKNGEETGLQSDSLSIVTPAGLMEYMEQHPKEFTRDDRRKILSAILHYSLFGFNESTNHANFPLALRTINSLTQEELANAVRESNELLTKMARMLLKHVHEDDVEITFKTEGTLLQQLGVLQLELQKSNARIAKLEDWKAKQLEIGEIAQAQITYLTDSNTHYREELRKKKKEVDTARGVVDYLRAKASDPANLKDDEKTVFELEGQLFEAETKFRTLEMEFGFLTRRLEEGSLDLAYDESGDLQLLKDKVETSVNEISSLSKDKSALARQVDSQEAFNKDLQNLIALGQKKTKQLEDDIKALKAELLEMHEEIDSMSNMAKVRDEEVATLRASVQKMSRLVTIRDGEIASVKSELQDVHEHNAELRVEMSKLRVENAELAKDHEKVSALQSLDFKL